MRSKKSDAGSIKKIISVGPIRICSYIKKKTIRFTVFAIYYVCRLMPLKNKVIASSFNGKKYGDNSQYIIEELHRIHPDLDFVWAKDDEYNYSVPSYVRTISYWSKPYRRAYEYATAKVWIDTHRLRQNTRKRKGQLFIETWHGGIAIKKLDGDVPKFRVNENLMKQLKTTDKYADLWISNSDQLTGIYRRAFYCTGHIWKCGYPRNDVLFKDNSEIRKKICGYYNLKDDVKIMLYAPTFRDSFVNGNIDMSVYNVDHTRLYKALCDKFSGEWVILTRMHPFLANREEVSGIIKGDNVIDATKYPDMQELLCACDAFLTDYSSGIFEAALRDIPCFTFATDFEDYKGDRGTYFEMDELPFPYAKNNDELVNNIENYNHEEYLADWEAFKKRTGFYETGHAAKDIAHVINEFVNGNKKALEKVKKEKCV